MASPEATARVKRSTQENQCTDMVVRGTSQIDSLLALYKGWKALKIASQNGPF